MVAVVRRCLVLVIALSWMSVSGGSRFALAQSGTPTAAAAAGQEAAATKADEGERPLPDIPALMRAVEVNQRASEAIEKDYMYRSVQIAEETNGHGGVKKTENREYDVFWVNGVPVHRLTKKNGKELSAEEQKKESDQIDKEVAKAKEKRAKADEKGTDTGPRGEELVTVSRLLELGSFTNARRVQLNGRDTIAVDFTGDPKAKTKNRFEDVIRDLAGTVWVDEQDRMLVKAEGHFLNNFKVGGGIVVNIQKGTSFSMAQQKVNGEVWLPAMVAGHGHFRALLFVSFNGSFRAVESDYRKFKATSTILPGMKTVEPEPEPK
jgi:frataxin-like iron-binding protein CyaY